MWATNIGTYFYYLAVARTFSTATSAEQDNGTLKNIHPPPDEGGKISADVI
jgi:hypothetical protein